MSNVYEALGVIQSKLKAPKGQRNKFGNYNYRSCEDILEAVKPILNETGTVLTLSDEPHTVDGWHYVKATASLFKADDPSVKIEVTAHARESEQKKGMDDSQITGTASSYARKYALNGLFCIDDTKDADTDSYHRQTTAKTEKSSDKSDKPKKQSGLACERCGAPVTGDKTHTPQEWADGVKKHTGMLLCRKCFNEWSKEANKTNAE